MAAFTNDSDILSIIEACRCVGGDKIQERRKNVEILEKLLQNQSYVNILDAKTDSNQGFTWNDVFKAACKYMNKVLHGI